MYKIATHPGRAHKDDLLSAAVLLATVGNASTSDEVVWGVLEMSLPVLHQEVSVLSNSTETV